MFYSVLDRTPKLDIDDFQPVIKTVEANTKTKNKSAIPIVIQSTPIIGGGVTGIPFEDTITDEITYRHISKPAQKPIRNPTKTTSKFSISKPVNNCVFDIPTILKDPEYF